MAALYEIRQIITDLAMCYPEWKPPNMAGTIKQYEEALQGFPVDLLRRAAKRCRDACVYFPKIAEIRKAISEIRAGDVPDTGSEYKEKIPISPEIQKYLADFRRRMVSKGQWKEARPSRS